MCGRNKRAREIAHAQKCGAAKCAPLSERAFSQVERWECVFACKKVFAAARTQTRQGGTCDSHKALAIEA